MKNGEKYLVAASSAFLLVFVVLSSSLLSVPEATSAVHADLRFSCQPYKSHWWRIETGFITILFPSGGKKPMFLWWYSNDTTDVYLVKYKGPIEYMTLDNTYYTCA